MFRHDASLEAAILAAPLESAPRMVYADWLMTAGDPRGEWMALASAIEREPQNRRLRSLAVEMLGDRGELLLGDGLALLPGAWIGWRGGFIDELRLQPLDDEREGTVAAFAALLAHPSARFLRFLALGEFAERDAMLDAVVAAAPPLLEGMVVLDDQYPMVEDFSLDRLAKLPALRQLGLNRSTLTEPLRRITELAAPYRVALDPIQRGMFPNLENLTLEGGNMDSVAEIANALVALPRLRRLRIVGLDNAQALASQLPALELVDVTSEPVAREFAEQTQRGESWLHRQLAAGGRDALRLMPGIGHRVFNVGTRLSIDGHAAAALPLLDASLTLPGAGLKTWAWANAAIAHADQREFDDAELIAREGLLHAPDEPNLYATIIDALRRSDRLSQAVELLPKAIASITADCGPGAHSGGPGACLMDCMLVLQHAGDHARVARLAEEHPEYLVPRTHAILAMSEVARGNLEEARTLMRAAQAAKADPLYQHARAVLALAKQPPDREAARAALKRAQQDDYPEWHFIARDPLLAALRQRATTAKKKPAAKAAAKTPAKKPAKRASVAAKGRAKRAR